MSVEALDHVNLRTPDVPSTAAFFAKVIGLTITPSPGCDDPARASWLCDSAGRAVVHLARQDIAYPWEPEEGVPAGPPGSGRVHHMALRCTGYDTMRTRIEASGVAMHANNVPEAKLRQLFVIEPNGLMIELNFFQT